MVSIFIFGPRVALAQVLKFPSEVCFDLLVFLFW